MVQVVKKKKKVYRLRLSGGEADGVTIELPGEIDEDKAVRVARGIASTQGAESFTLEEVITYQMEPGA